MNNLIPEVRVNKNGVPVVKHVLPPSAGGSKSSIPALSMIPVQTDDWARDEPLIREYLATRTDSSDDIVWRMAKLDPVVRRQVTDALLSGDYYSSSIALRTMEHAKAPCIPYIMGTLKFHRSLHLAVFEDEMSGKYRDTIQASAYSSLSHRFSFEFFGTPEGEVTPERMDYFKADIVDEAFDFRHVYPVNFERHAAVRVLVENLDLIEPALPAMAHVKKGMRHWRQEKALSTDAPYLLVTDMLEIARVVQERPDSAGHFYQYARLRGEFDAQGFLTMIDTKAPALFEGAL